MTLLLTVLLALSSAPPDRRLAAAATAFVQPGDPLADDQPIAACVADHLPTATPLQLVPRDQADVVLIVRGRFSTSSVQLRAEAPDGTAIWFGSTSLTRHTRDEACTLADAALTKLRDGMRKARDAK